MAHRIGDAFWFASVMEWLDVQRTASILPNAVILTVHRERIETVIVAGTTEPQRRRTLFDLPVIVIVRDAATAARIAAELS